MPVVGTAGHVDHGKSTLIERLTGRDPDRWREEQERGLTIDLGFAWMTLPSGTEIGFVDVPGHDRFIKNMLAGVEAIDVALFVVAADEGWMPQSEEHLAVLDLLDVNSGVVALTKTDRVDADLIELATLEIEEHLQGTSLDGIEVVAVSAHTGDGVDQLISAVDRLVSDLPDRGGSRARMWVDRSFSIAGAGTVVTGTLLDGPLSVGDEVEVVPGGVRGRIRGLQSHEESRDAVAPGTRVAVNVSGVNRDLVARGSMLTLPDLWLTSSRFVATVQAARYVDELTNRGAYHLHLGSGSWPARIRRIGDRLVRVDLDDAVPISVGDRFILRDAGRRLVVAGGRVIDPAPPRPKHFTDEATDLLISALALDPTGRADALLTFRGADTSDRISAHTGGGVPTEGFRHGDHWVSFAEQERITSRVRDTVTRYHQDHPLRPGIGIAELAVRLDLGTGLVTALVADLDDLVVDGAHVSAVGFSIEFDPNQRTAIDAAKHSLAEAGTASVPRATELDLDPPLLHAAVRAGEFVQISADFVYLPAQIEELLAVIDSFEEPFGVSEFRDAAGLSRKYAVPFLEWTDDTARTVRTGDTRRKR